MVKEISRGFGLWKQILNLSCSWLFTESLEEARWADPAMKGPGTDHWESDFKKKKFFLLYLTNVCGSMLWANCGPGALIVSKLDLWEFVCEQAVALGLLGVRKLWPWGSYLWARCSPGPSSVTRKLHCSESGIWSTWGEKMSQREVVLWFSREMSPQAHMVVTAIAGGGCAATFNL